MNRKKLLNIFYSVVFITAAFCLISSGTLIIQDTFLKLIVKQKVVTGETINKTASEISSACENNFYCMKNEIVARVYNFNYDYDFVKSSSTFLIIPQLLTLRNAEQIAKDNSGVCLDQIIYVCALAKALNISCYMGVTQGTYYAGRQQGHAFAVLSDGSVFESIGLKIGEYGAVIEKIA